METIIRCHHSRARRVVVFVAILAAGKLTAQLPGVPVLQNAFANPGLTIAVNYGRSDSAPGVCGRRRVGAGQCTISDDRRIRAQSIQRAAARSSGVGRACGGTDHANHDGRKAGHSAHSLASAAHRRTTRSLLHVPAGASVSFRTRLGERRGISFYAAPFYSWTRATHRG